MRYTWALHFGLSSPEARHLSENGRIGLNYAHALAQNHRVRSSMSLYDRWRMPARLTIAELAKQEQLSPIQLNRYIRQARVEIFGKDLSQSAIYYRLKTQEQRRNRTCAEPHCDTPLQPTDPLTLLYCREHRTPKHRTRRHREQKRQRELEARNRTRLTVV